MKSVTFFSWAKECKKVQKSAQTIDSKGPKERAKARKRKKANKFFEPKGVNAKLGSRIEKNVRSVRERAWDEVSIKNGV